MADHVELFIHLPSAPCQTGQSIQRIQTQSGRRFLQVRWQSQRYKYMRYFSAPSPYNEMPHQMERPKTSDALSTATTTTMGRSVRNGNRASFKSSFNRSEYRFGIRRLDTSITSSSSSSSNRLLRTCLLVSVTFLVCWFPFACLNPLMSYYPKWFGAPYGWVLHEVSIWMGQLALIVHLFYNAIFRMDEFCL